MYVIFLRVHYDTRSPDAPVCRTAAHTPLKLKEFMNIFVGKYETDILCRHNRTLTLNIRRSTMPSTTTTKKRTKRPDARPNGKRRRKEHQAEAEKDRLERVAKNEAKGKIVAVPRLAKLFTVDVQEQGDDVKGADPATKGQKLRKESKAPVESRVRALHKILRQIQVLEEKEKTGEKLDDAQKAKVARFDAVISELEEHQKVEESESDNDEDDEGESDDDEQ